MKVVQNATHKKGCYWKPKLAQLNVIAKTTIYGDVFYEEKILMITHNTMLWKKVMDDNLQNNATIGHHEKNVSDKMKNKQIKSQIVELASEWKEKILKANKHKIQEENTKTPWSKKMRNITKWPCSRKGDGSCEDPHKRTTHVGWCIIDFERKNIYYCTKLWFHVWIIIFKNRLTF